MASYHSGDLCVELKKDPTLAVPAQQGNHLFLLDCGPVRCFPGAPSVLKVGFAAFVGTVVVALAAQLGTSTAETSLAINLKPSASVTPARGIFSVLPHFFSGNSGFSRHSATTSHMISPCRAQLPVRGGLQVCKGVQLQILLLQE